MSRHRDDDHRRPHTYTLVGGLINVTAHSRRRAYVQFYLWIVLTAVVIGLLSRFWL